MTLLIDTVTGFVAVIIIIIIIVVVIDIFRVA